MTDLTGILAQDSLYRHPELLVTFMGNHDQPRFLTIAKQSISSLLMAQTFLLTSRGIPHLYYGDEVAMYEPVREERSMRADFPGGFPGDPVNAFRAEGRTGDAALVFDHLRSLLHFRRDHEALRRGSLMNLVTEKDRYVYLRSSPGEHVLVVLNRAGGSAPLLIDTSDLDVVEGTTFQPMGEGTAAIVRNGKLEISSPGDAVVYWAARVKQK